ncbi:GFA family protein [Pseudoalteromonas umbrosa]|uniref:GFA family protein n=1 Tax=Pseudoalteromonas umbrosa TaxID=3048489 RepID=UPI0024C429B7|nr:GFA family protein [Pseudoalteromonas sp. B95]MDK1289998.1 GFA family protein [Pseudoalteromonas sp. B95]
MYKASCLCKGVQLEINGSIDNIIHCHCSLCRKSSGTAYATNGFIDTSSLKIVTGQELVNAYAFKPGRLRHFCRNCASPLFSSNVDLPEKLRIRLGILDSDINERPASHNFMASKANWDQINAQIPHYEEFEPGRMKRKS